MSLRKINIDKDLVIEKYNNDMSIEEIAHEMNVSWSHIYNIVCKMFSCNLYNITDNNEKDIVSLYKNGLSITKIAEKYKLYHKYVSKILDKYDVKRINNGKRKYCVNEHYFDNIDTPNKAYILGLLFADGYNSIDKDTVRICLTYNDKYILERINDELDSNFPITFINYDKIDNKPHDTKNMYQLNIYSSYICKKLESYGMVKNKSLVLKYPKNIPNQFQSHFIRGYFDGNGSFCYYTNKYGTYNSTITITSTYDFCVGALETMREQISVGGGIYDTSCHNGITSVLTFCGNIQNNKIFEWLYKDSDMYLERKYTKFLNLFYK